MDNRTKETLEKVDNHLHSAHKELSNWPEYYSWDSEEGKAMWNKQIAISRAMYSREDNDE